MEGRGTPEALALSEGMQHFLGFPLLHPPIASLGLETALTYVFALLLNSLLWGVAIYYVARYAFSALRHILLRPNGLQSRKTNRE